MANRLEKVEDTNLDYKEKFEENRLHSWLKSVSAFANTEVEALYLAFGMQIMKL